MESKHLKILITGAGGQIGYSLLPILCTGEVFGKSTFLTLNLLELPKLENELMGLRLELIDSCFPLVKSINIGSNPKVLMEDIDVAIFLGGSPRKPGMERRDLLEINGDIFKQQGKILNEVASPNCRILVVANPANTNCSILQTYCPRIPKKNFTCLNRLGLNRARAAIAEKTGCNLGDIKNVIIWGNQSNSVFTDINLATIKEKPISEVIQDSTFLKEKLVKTVQKRSADILELRKRPACLSGAIAVRDHLREWYDGTPGDYLSCMGIISDGSFYDIPKGICISVPVRCKDFEYEVVRDIKIDQLTKDKIQMSVKELLEEKEQALGELSEGD